MIFECESEREANLWLCLHMWLFYSYSHSLIVSLYFISCSITIPFKLLVHIIAPREQMYPVNETKLQTSCTPFIHTRTCLQPRFGPFIWDNCPRSHCGCQHQQRNQSAVCVDTHTHEPQSHTELHNYHIKFRFVSLLLLTMFFPHTCLVFISFSLYVSADL